MGTLTPDGVRYAAASERRVARPFHYRWLMPKLCGRVMHRWHVASRVSSWALLPLTWWYVGGVRGIAAAALVAGLAGVWHFNREHPVLVDLHGMALALLSADAFRHHVWPLGLAAALLGGCVRETSPLFAAAWAWNPWALLGMIPVGVRHVMREGPDVLDPANRWVLDHPLKASAQFHLGRTSNPDLPTMRPPLAAYVLPWGVALIALAHPSTQLLTVLALAYAQCAVATDTVRLYQWAWPVMLAGAVGAVPLDALIPLVLVHLCNPFRSDGA